MKRFKMIVTTLMTAALAICVSSCTTEQYFQVYKANGTNVKTQNEGLVYDDSNCQLTYNLWSDGGNAGFLFENKTDQTIYIHLDKCFFIENGIANDYFLNRSFGSGAINSFGIANSTSIAAAPSSNSDRSILSSFGLARIIGLGASSSSKESASYSKSVTFNEKSLVAIPPHSSKRVSEYCIAGQIYRSCNLMLFPTAKRINPLNFDENSSPIRFTNYITYSLGEKGAEQTIVNNFYVAQIKNLSEKDESYDSKEVDCDNNKLNMKVMKDASPSAFFRSYTNREYKGHRH